MDVQYGCFGVEEWADKLQRSAREIRGLRDSEEQMSSGGRRRAANTSRNQQVPTHYCCLRYRMVDRGRLKSCGSVLARVKRVQRRGLLAHSIRGDGFGPKAA